MKKIRYWFREGVLRRAHYFREAEAEVLGKNLLLLKSHCLGAVVLLLFFYAATPLIIPRWTMTVQHACFLPAVLLLYGGIVFYQRREKHSARGVLLLCLLFETVLFLFVILIDVRGAFDVPASFMPVLCVALPTLFILPFRWTYSLMFTWEAVFIASVCLYKSAEMARCDVFNSVVGVAFSVIVAKTVMGLRIQDYEVRMKYENLSTRDSLSGILNKKACKEAVERYLASHNPDTTCVLLMLDIDNFKAVNDQLGHYTGDILLRAIGELLSEVFRASDVVGRFGGDEFIVLVKGMADAGVLESKCNLVRERLRDTVSVDPSFRITCSIGGVLVDGQRAEYESLFRQTDDALYQAKAEGKDRCAICRYQQEMPGGHGI